MAAVFPVRAVVGFRDGTPMWISVEASPQAAVCYDADTIKPKKEERDNAPRFK